MFDANVMMLKDGSEFFVRSSKHITYLCRMTRHNNKPTIEMLIDGKYQIVIPHDRMSFYYFTGNKDLTSFWCEKEKAEAVRILSDIYLTESIIEATE